MFLINMNHVGYKIVQAHSILLSCSVYISKTKSIIVINANELKNAGKICQPRWR